MQDVHLALACRAVADVDRIILGHDIDDKAFVGRMNALLLLPFAF
jgi:hypothetical protein